jgi:hypothetical protein
MSTDRRPVERLTLPTSCTVRAEWLPVCRRRDRTDHRVAGLTPQTDKLGARAVYDRIPPSIDAAIRRYREPTFT